MLSIYRPEHIGTHVGLYPPVGGGRAPSAADHQLVQVIVGITLEITYLLVLITCLDAPLTSWYIILDVQTGEHACLSGRSYAVQRGVATRAMGTDGGIAADTGINGPAGLRVVLVLAVALVAVCVLCGHLS